MLTRKDMVKCQKMIAYLEVYDRLIQEDTNNFVTDRKRSDMAHAYLIKAAKKALNDRDLAE
jgi:hypothetical protein